MQGKGVCLDYYLLRLTIQEAGIRFIVHALTID